jgi:S-adenosylmethionine decarboxylase proenzyme
LDLVLIDLHECNREKLMDPELIRGGMLEAARIMGAEVIGHAFHTFEPWGVSGTVTVAESHLAIHTWPEYNFAAVTFETCGGHMDHKKAHEYLTDFFGSRRPQISYLKRGFMDFADAGLKYKQVVG